jgi:hypothetical protein
MIILPNWELAKKKPKKSPRRTKGAHVTSHRVDQRPVPGASQTPLHTPILSPVESDAGSSADTLRETRSDLATARPAFLSHDPAELTRLLVDESPRSKRGIPVIEA